MLKRIWRQFLHKRVRMRNARRYKRFRSDFLVKYVIDRKGEAHVTNARDIGAGGLRFWTDREIPESSILSVSIYIPPLGRTVDAVAQVCRVRKAKGGMMLSVAVSFLDLKKEDREAINEFAESLSRDKGAEFLIDHADVVVRRATHP